MRAPQLSRVKDAPSASPRGCGQGQPQGFSPNARPAPREARTFRRRPDAPPPHDRRYQARRAQRSARQWPSECGECGDRSTISCHRSPFPGTRQKTADSSPGNRQGAPPYRSCAPCLIRTICTTPAPTRSRIRYGGTIASSRSPPLGLPRSGCSDRLSAASFSRCAMRWAASGRNWWMCPWIAARSASARRDQISCATMRAGAFRQACPTCRATGRPPHVARRARPRYRPGPRRRQRPRPRRRSHPAGTVQVSRRQSNMPLRTEGRDRPVTPTPQLTPAHPSV